MITIDAKDVLAFAADAGAARVVYEEEAAKATNAAAVEGAGYMQEAAPVDQGNLRDEIRVLRTAGVGNLEATYGVNTLEYANQRNFGGTIYPRNGEFLVFEIDGELIFARSVTQTGDHFMETSAERLEPLLPRGFELAIERALARLGG